ncbi:MULTISPECIES: S8 family serine peptidase [Flavobacterium]|uniref:S8 family serine peptidase n=1 Tax=Flavobacterium sedimenticola TaxID=3043286 RepID=A0ABT6XUG7_9FLAO|nr:S8 family serine peptidase [Flavobacterium sedimenticola]MDI9258259.1 S8 family serine peptidase [Flavobacterium sedimenticola]
MRKIFFYLSIFFLTTDVFSQETYVFLVEVADKSQMPKFSLENGILVYSGDDIKEKSFFENYKVLDFQQAFPDSKRQQTLNVFTFITYDKTLMEELMNNFPEKYIRYEDVSDFKGILLDTYPNDYGTTSPILNTGINASLKNFDYIGVPKAWDFEPHYGSLNVSIGISDSAIDTADIDFKEKITLLPGYFDWSYNPPYSLTNDSWHGTGVAAIAAAWGNNYHGTVGICANCKIIFTKFLYGNPGTVLNPTPNFNRLLQLAINGANVINMSWRHIITTNNNDSFYQWIFDELYEDYNVVCVAASGNETSFDAAYANNNYMLYDYPASYNHVISVGSVNHLNKWGDVTVNEPGWGQVTRFAEDQISPSVVMDYQGNGPYSFSNATHTTNDKIDIMAPGYNSLIYPWYVLGNVDSHGNNLYYGSGTSQAAPHVSGTVGLMLSVNQCLIVDEVEDVLQLTSKNLEHIPGNEPYLGRSGAGKLETGDAVEFTYEMMNASGNALIDGQDFWRFDFDLQHINNKLTISNQIFRDSNTSNFVAKNEIEVLQNSDFRPNNNGFVDLKIDGNLTVCLPTSKSSGITKDIKEPAKVNKAILYPNPNQGSFSISLNNTNLKDISVTVLDVSGKIIYQTKVIQNDFELTIPNLSTGIYLVKLSSNEFNETLKFVKQ